MKKLLLLILFTSIGGIFLFSQITKKAVALKNVAFFSVGDTMTLYGFRIHPSSHLKQYLIKENTFIPAKKVKVLDDNLDYWEQLWFNIRGADFKKSGPELKKRKELKALASEFYAENKADDLIYEDELLYDYLYQLLMQIHPKKIAYTSPGNLGIIIIKSSELNFFTFDNGYIVLTTGLIANTQNEKMLMTVLSHCVSRIVSEFNFVLLDQYTNGKKVKNLLAVVNNGALKYMSGLNENIFLSDEIFTVKMSNIISYAAWQDYYEMNYRRAVNLVEKLEKSGLATEKDYLLHSKLLRVTSNTKASNLKALSFIKKAEETGLSNLIDLDKEAGILYLRLNDKKNAKDAFEAYKKGLLELEKLGFDMSDEMEYVNLILYRKGMMD